MAMITDFVLRAAQLICAIIVMGTDGYGTKNSLVILIL
jgi:hypothetical protein